MQVELQHRGGIMMFTVKKSASSNKTVRLPNELIERLERIAAENDVSFNRLVVQCCEYALEQMPESAGKAKGE